MFALALLAKAAESKPWRDTAQGNPGEGLISRALADYETAAAGVGLKLAKVWADCIRLIMLTGCRPIEAQLGTSTVRCGTRIF
jgi:hypothetical protein